MSDTKKKLLFIIPSALGVLPTVMCIGTVALIITNYRPSSNGWVCLSCRF